MLSPIKKIFIIHSSETTVTRRGVEFRMLQPHPFKTIIYQKKKKKMKKVIFVILKQFQLLCELASWQAENRRERKAKWEGVKIEPWIHY